MRKKNPPVPPPPPPMPRDLSGVKDFLYKNTTNFDIGNKKLQNRETLVCFFLYFLGSKHQFRDKSNWVSPQHNNEENASRFSQEDSGRGRGRAKRKG